MSALITRSAVWTAGLSAGIALGPIISGLLIGVLFVRRQRRLHDPAIDVGLFRRRAFSAAIAVNVLAIFGLVGFAFLATQYLELVLGLRPLTAALWQVPVTALTAAAAPAAAALAGRPARRPSSAPAW